MIEIDFETLCGFSPNQLKKLGIQCSETLTTASRNIFVIRFRRGGDNVDIDFNQNECLKFCMFEAQSQQGTWRVHSKSEIIGLLDPIHRISSWPDWVQDNPEHNNYSLSKIAQHWFQLKKEVLEEKKETLNR